MLNSEKARAFVQNFTGQWLDLRNIDATSSDKKLHPEADELLVVSMVQETEKFFAEMLARNLSVTNFIQSDFAMLNSRLASLRHRRRERRRIPQSPAPAGQPARRSPDAGEHPESHGQWHHHFAGFARRVGLEKSARHAHSAQSRRSSRIGHPALRLRGQLFKRRLDGIENAVGGRGIIARDHFVDGRQIFGQHRRVRFGIAH